MSIDLVEIKSRTFCGAFKPDLKKNDESVLKSDFANAGNECTPPFGKVFIRPISNRVLDELVRNHEDHGALRGSKKAKE
jgi:hypothetical protein